MILPISTRVENIRQQRNATSNQEGVGARNYTVQLLPEEYSFLMRHKTTRIVPLTRVVVVPTPNAPSVSRLVGNVSN